MSWFLTIIDTAGQEDFSALRHVYFRTGDAFVLVYSVTDRFSFEKIETFYKQILRVKDAPSVPIVVIGNKNDLVLERVVTLAEGKELAKRLGNVPFMESSAKSGLNVSQMYHAAVREVKKRRKMTSTSRMDATKSEDDARHGKSKKSHRCTIL
jgi:small GTP-binding protein